MAMCLRPLKPSRTEPQQMLWDKIAVFYYVANILLLTKMFLNALMGFAIFLTSDAKERSLWHMHCHMFALQGMTRV